MGAGVGISNPKYFVADFSKDLQYLGEWGFWAARIVAAVCFFGIWWKQLTGWALPVMVGEGTTFTFIPCADDDNDDVDDDDDDDDDDDEEYNGITWESGNMLPDL